MIPPKSSICKGSNSECNWYIKHKICRCKHICIVFLTVFLFTSITSLNETVKKTWSIDVYVLRNLLFTMNSKVFNLVQRNSLVF